MATLNSWVETRFRDTKIISVNWNGWLDDRMMNRQIFSQEPGFIAKESMKPVKDLYEIMILNSASYEENAELFYRLISQNIYEQVVVSRFDINKLKHTLFKQNKIQPLDREITIIEDSYTETEYQIALIFGEVLGIEQISVHDDFFRLGGNSILAIQLSHRMSRVLDCDVKVADVFRFKSIIGLIENIKILDVDEGNVEKEF